MATLRDIAQHVGISVSTVSLALRDHPSISLQTKRKAWEAQELLGYRKPLKTPSFLNGKKKGLGGTMRTIAYVTIDRTLENSSYHASFHRITTEARQRQWRTSYVSITSEELREDVIPAELFEGNVDGIIVSGLVNVASYDRLSRLGVPMVVMGPYDLGTEPWMACEPDFRHGAKLITEKFGEYKHKRIGLIGSNPQTPYKKFLTECLMREFKQYGMELVGETYVEGNDIKSSDLGNVKNLLAMKPTAVVLLTDFVASMVYAVCEIQGMKIPEDISIISFLGQGSDVFLNPPLTRLYVRKGISITCVEKLERLMNDPDAPRTRELFPYHLLPGESVASPACSVH